MPGTPWGPCLPPRWGGGAVGRCTCVSVVAALGLGTLGGALRGACAVGLCGMVWLGLALRRGLVLVLFCFLSVFELQLQ